MKVHYVIHPEEKTLCGKRKRDLDYVGGFENIHKVTCIICINSIEANASESVDRVSYYQVKQANNV